MCNQLCWWAHLDGLCPAGVAVSAVLGEFGSASVETTALAPAKPHHDALEPSASVHDAHSRAAAWCVFRANTPNRRRE